MIRLIGAVFVITGCGSIGFAMAKRLLNEISALRSLIAILEFWKNALSYHHTTLPELCGIACTMDTQSIGDFFRVFGMQLERQGASDASQCIESALSMCPDVPESSRILVGELGRGLGEFDLAGQLYRLDSVLNEANNTLTSLTSNLSVRLRSYRILSVCAGLAIAILII